MDVRRLLDRLCPHDTIMVGGEPYMRRWYLFGYAPTPDDPDQRMICASCGRDVVLVSGTWLHRRDDGVLAAVRTHEDASGIRVSGTLVTVALDHEPVAISASRPGWRWRDYGIGMARIHEILTSDDNRAFHDHPWPFLAVGLRGSYIEETPWIHDGTVPLPGSPLNWRRRRRAPFLNRKRATDLHVLHLNGPVWTLFLTRPKVRSWGFAGPFGWLGWRNFDEAFPERDAWVET